VLSSQIKANFCQLARQIGLNISVQVPGQGSRDLSKDAIICKIIEKRYVDASISDSAPQIDTETVTIDNLFCLINVSFLTNLSSYRISVEAWPQ
jgi:hypothetical protein